jgi:hypothetical protein
MRRTIPVALLVVVCVAARPRLAQSDPGPTAYPDVAASCRLLDESAAGRALGTPVRLTREVPAGAGRLCTYFADSATRQPLLEIGVTDFGTEERAIAAYRNHERVFLRDKPLAARLDTLDGIPVVIYHPKGIRESTGQVLRKGTRLLVIHVLPAGRDRATAAQAQTVARLALRRLS